MSIINKALSILNEDKFYGLSIDELLNSALKFEGKTLIFFDTETTGLNPMSIEGMVTETAAWVVDGSTMEVLEEYNYKANLTPEVKDILNKKEDSVAFQKYKAEYELKLSKSNSKFKPLDLRAILDLTRYEEETAPFVEEKQMLLSFKQLIEKYSNVILIAHNAGFDMKQIVKRGSVYDIKYPKVSVLDTLKITRLFFQPLLQTLNNDDSKPILQAIFNKERKKYSSRLGDLAKAFDIKTDNWHNAFADVEMMVKVLAKMIELFKKYRHSNLDVTLQAKSIKYDKLIKSNFKKKKKNK